MAEKKTSEKVKQSIEKFKAKRETDIEVVKAINRESSNIQALEGGARAHFCTSGNYT